ncbi:MAG: hypothetical protein JWQ98_2657 [Chlorobi bacterium]|nr:hypothetical protein [Chlorobiota bacterium]
MKQAIVSKHLAGLLFAIAMIVSAGGICHAQDDDIPTEKLPYFGVGAGYVRIIGLIDFDGMNNTSRSFGLGEFSGPFSMNMGGLMFTPGFIKNLRAGFFAGAGSKENSRSVTVGGAEYTRTIYFTDVVVTSQVDYAVPLSSSFAMFFGSFLGGGRYTFGVSQTQSTGVKFDSVFASGVFGGDPNVTNFNRFAREISYHVFFTPSVNFEYTLTPNIMFRVGAGYNLSFKISDWADEGGVTIANSPAIGANGIALQVGVFGGLFQH